MAEVTADSLGKLTVAVLKERLAERGLDTKGLKAALVARLVEALQKVRIRMDASHPGAVLLRPDTRRVWRLPALQESADPSGAEAEPGAKPDPPAGPDVVPEKPVEPEARQEEPEGAPSEQLLQEEPAVTAQATPPPPPAPPPEDVPPAPPVAQPPAEREAAKRKEAPAEEACLAAVPAEAEPPAAKRAREADAAPAPEATAAVFVECLVRPFTNSGLKQLLASAGGVFDEAADFWMPPIKNMAVVVYQTPEQAASTVGALDGREWPVGQGHRLRVRHIPVTDARRAIAAGSMAPVPGNAKAASAGQHARDGRGGAAAGAGKDEPAKTLETLFKKTQATPRIFWLPVSEEQAARRKAQLSEAVKAEPTHGS